MWQFLFTLFVSLVQGKRILVGHHNIGVILQYSHILQTQTRFIIQLSTPYRVTLCHTMSHCHCTGWKQPQLTAFLTVWHHFYSLRAETVVRGREGRRDTMRERDIERDTEKNRVRERMRKREGGMEWDRRGRERERERERDKKRERARERESERARERDRQTDREIESDRKTKIETERDRQTETQRERQTETETSLLPAHHGFSVHLFLRLSVEERKHSLRLLLVYTPSDKHLSLTNTHFYHTYLLCTTTLT